MTRFILSSILLLLATIACAQDSISVRIYPKYDSVGRVHRLLFGENYRKEYAMPVKVPIIRLSVIKGGLTPTQRGGGNQSHSLRLVDSSGREWVLRSVEKFPEVLLPAIFRKTFAGDAIKDNMSAQNPFSALVVPEIAKAAGVPHSDPLIGWVLPDEKLGVYAEVFQNTLCLLEEREPAGDTDNSAKMMRKLNENNDNTYNAPLFLKAKALDALLGDWDRHEDQWRWKPEKGEDGAINYQPVPRDRDQVFYLSEGLVPRYAQASWLLPMIQGYERQLPDINWFFWEGRDLYSKWFSGLDEAEWTRVVADFCVRITDEVLEKALMKLPEPGYTLRHDQLLAQLKLRRAKLPAMMNNYYRFLNKIVDVQATHKNELVVVKDAPGNGLTITISKISKDGFTKHLMFNRTFDPAITKEIRLYVKDGNDSLILDNQSSRIRLKIIGAEGEKKYHIEHALRRVPLYGRNSQVQLSGRTEKIKKHFASDTTNTQFVPVDLYTRKMLLLNASYNLDDRILLGLSYKIVQPGFRKMPYGSIHSFSFLHSFATSGHRFNYNAELFKLWKNADVTLRFDAFAPENSQNFYGLGNETSFKKSGDFIRFHRARFSLYQFDPALRWKTSRSAISIGPSLQYYRYNENDNKGRFTEQVGELHSPDSATISKNKMFAGLVLGYVWDSRNSAVLPTSGTFLDTRFTAYKGLNEYANSLAQVTASISLYQPLDNKKKIVLSNRIGGGLTFGNHAFYQSQFLGGQGNLLGYREFRFGGQHSLYNNLEMRIKVTDFINYIMPGQFGILGFHDIGRVWRKNERSEKWHQGYGGGIYFAPASLTVFRLIMAHSREGWYPYVAMKFRY